LDRDIPIIHGDEVCRRLVADGSESRILMLTAARGVADRVEGLGLGADDYLPKPFDFSELVARIRALGRRSRPALPPTLVQGDLRLDSARRVATRAQRRLDLSPKEFAVLELLLAAGGAVVSQEEIFESVWDETLDPFSQAVKTTISRLRAKLGEPPLIETMAKSGYRMLG
jgi:DNA-binding response OmpR family regulator